MHVQYLLDGAKSRRGALEYVRGKYVRWAADTLSSKALTEMSPTVNGQVRQDLAHARRAACHNPSAPMHRRRSIWRQHPAMPRLEIHSVQAVCFPDFRPKSHFCAVVFCNNTTARWFGRKSSKLCWMAVGGGEG